MAGHLQLNILQHNTNKSGFVVDQLRQLAFEKRASVLALQEPPIRQGRVVGFGSMTRVFQKQTAGMASGAAVVVLGRELDAMLLDDISSHNIVAVQIEREAGKMVVISAYLPPSEGTRWYLDELRRIMDLLGDRNVIICGDFNAHCEAWGSPATDARGEEVAQWILECNLALCNDPAQGPTFRGPRGEEYDDLTLAANRTRFHLANWTSAFQTTSDHSAISFNVLMDEEAFHIESLVRYHTRDVKWEAFRAELESATVSYVLCATYEGADLGGDLADLDNAMHMAALATLRRKATGGHRPVPWWSAEISRQRARVRRARRLFQRSSGDERNPRRVLYLDEKRKLKSLVRRRKRESWRLFVRVDVQANPWGIVYRVIRDKIHPDYLLGALVVNGRRARSTHEACQMYLEATFPVDDPTADTPEERRIREAAVELPDTEEAPLWTMEDLDGAIGRFGRGKAPGLDGIDMAMIKEAPQIYRQELLNLFNRALQTGTFPAAWKVANIKALTKPGDRDLSSSSSYRPVSLLAMEGKVLERLILDTVSPVLEGASHPRQYGCTAGRNTEMAVRSMIEVVRGSRARHVMAVFFDIAGAFNAVWWPVVLRRLAEIEIPRNIYLLLQSYFSDRWAKMYTASGVAEWRVTRGCPQGSVLGPAVWNLVFSDLLRRLDQEDWEQFAFVDDLAVVIQSRTRAGLVAEAARCAEFVRQWCTTVRLELAVEKTKALVFRGAGDHRHPTRFRVGDVVVQAEPVVRYLGVQMNTAITPTAHIAALTGRAVSLAAGLRRLSGPGWGTSYYERARYYKTVFLPIVMYAAPVWWDNPTQAHRQKIISLQRAALLGITRAYRTAPTLALQVIAGFEPLDLVLDARVAVASIRWPDRTAARVRPEIREAIEPYTEEEETMAAIDQWVADEWQQRWDAGPGGRFTHEFFPHIAARKEAAFISPGYEITQLLTGHGNFSGKLHYFRRRDSPSCPCGYEEETAEHVLRECPLHHGARQEHFRSYLYRGGLADLVATNAGFSQFEKFAAKWTAVRGEGPDLPEGER